jgi:hypothetical protein
MLRLRVTRTMVLRASRARTTRKKRVAMRRQTPAAAKALRLHLQVGYLPFVLVLFLRLAAAKGKSSGMKPSSGRKPPPPAEDEESESEEEEEGEEEEDAGNQVAAAGGAAGEEEEEEEESDE